MITPAVEPIPRSSKEVRTVVVLWWSVAVAVVAIAGYWLMTARDRRVKAAFDRVVRVCDCGGTRRYFGMFGDKVEDNCNVCVRTRITRVADILDHDCLETDMVPLGAARVEDGFEVRDFRCQVCGQKHESCDGIMDIAMGAF